MLFTETLPAFYSIALMIAISATVFGGRFYIFRKKSLLRLYASPSILIAGSRLSGKTSLIKAITGNDISIHPFKGSLSLAYLKSGDKTLQVIEDCCLIGGKGNNLKDLMKLDLISLIYIFDVSKDSEPIEVQLESFENTRKIFDKVPFMVVANKADIADMAKIERLEIKFEKVYKTSALDMDSSKMKDSLLLEKESEDLSLLIRNISNEIETHKEEIKLT